MVRRYLVTLAVLAAAAAPALAQPGPAEEGGDRPRQREAMPRERGPDMGRAERGPRPPMARERQLEQRDEAREEMREDRDEAQGRGGRLERDERPQLRRERMRAHRERMLGRRSGPEHRLGRGMSPGQRQGMHRRHLQRRGPAAGDRGEVGKAGDECPRCGGPSARPERRMHHRPHAARAPRGDFRGPARDFGPQGRVGPGHGFGPGHGLGQGPAFGPGRAGVPGARGGFRGPRMHGGDRLDGQFRRPMGPPMGPMRRGPMEGRPL